MTTNDVINDQIRQLRTRLKSGESGQTLVPLLAALATNLERSEDLHRHDDARRLRSGLQCITRGGTYGGFVPDPL